MNPPAVRADLPSLRGLSLLLLGNDPAGAMRIHQALAQTVGHALKVVSAGAIVEGLHHLRHEAVDVILIDLSVSGGLSTEVCRCLSANAHGLPIIGLIDEEDVVSVSEAIEKGISAVYYRDQVDASLIRRLHMLVHRRRPGGRVRGEADGVVPMPATSRSPHSLGPVAQ